MIRYYALREDGHIGMTSDAPMPGAVALDFPDDFSFERQTDWRVMDGALVYEPITEPPSPPTLDERLTAMRDEYDAAFVELAGLIAGEV